MAATAILEPLASWLDEQNAGRPLRLGDHLCERERTERGEGAPASERARGLGEAARGMH